MDSFGKSAEPQPSTSSSALAAALLQRSRDSRRSSEMRNLDSPDTSNNNSLNLSHSLSNGWANTSSSFGPVRTSSLRAHRSSMYSRPNCLGSLDRTYISNRYFGNTSTIGGSGGKSLMLGTKKVSENVSGEPELTSTAQRIVKTLRTVETPIVNKEKVAMDSIKSLRPEMSTLKRKEPGQPGSGPPTRISPLEISPQSSLPPLKAPRMNNTFETNRHTLELSAEHDTEFEFSEAWSFDGIARGVRHMEKKNLDISSLLKLYKKDNVDSTKPLSGQLSAIVAKPDLTSNSPVTSKEEIKVNGSQDKPATVAQDEKWECPSCMVYNLAKVHSCVCCGEKNPNKTEAEVPEATTWECPTCMVVCKMTDESCVCCGESNPKRSKGEANGQASANSNEVKKPLADFKFGFGAPAAGNTASKTEMTNFKFGVGGKSTDEAKKPVLADFKFGFNVTATSTFTSEVSTDASKNAQAQPQADSSKTTTGSGGTEPQPEAKKEPNPNQNSSTQTQGRTFGVSAGDEEKALGPASIKVQPLSGFRFGMTPAKPTVTSDKPATSNLEEKTWRCNICNDESTPVSQLKCRGCDAVKPNLDESTPVKADAGNTKKDFSFEPYYGLKDENVVKEPAPKPFVSQLATPFSTPTQTPTTAAAPTFATAAPSPASALSPSINLPTTTAATTAIPSSTSSVSSPAAPQFPQFTSPAATSTPTPASTFNFNTSGEKASPGEKRKAETFLFNPGEPKLKTKPTAETAAPPQSEMKTGSFLEALKRQNEDRPDGGSTAPTSSGSASFGGAAFMKPTPAQVPTTSAPAPTPVFLLPTTTSTPTSSVTVPTTKPFNFSFTPQTTTPSIFGALAPAVTSVTSPSFGTTTTQSSIFGSQPTPALGFSASSTPSTVSQPAFASPPSVPAAFQFGQPSGTSTAGNGGLFVFGQQNAGQQSSGNGGFKPQLSSIPTIPASAMFGQPSTIPTPSFGANANAAPTPMFGTTANNFGATPAPTPMFNAPANNFGGVAQPPAFGLPQLPQPGTGTPALFTLGAQPTGERKIKKAIRRMK